jgi:hypothetical protein
MPDADGDGLIVPDFLGKSYAVAYKQLVEVVAARVVREAVIARITFNEQKSAIFYDLSYGSCRHFSPHPLSSNFAFLEATAYGLDPRIFACAYSMC